jgi:penicillin G amidase
MRILRFLSTLALTGALIWVLATPRQIGSSSLPPLGGFFNPFSGFWKNAESVTGLSFKDVRLPGLQGKVEVTYDDLMVPHIFAEHLEDAVKVQGYLHAANRLWQMDLMTRKASGRLSEILGERTLSTDRLTRRRGTAYAAERDLDAWRKNPENMKLLEAYAIGVNAYINQLKPKDYPIEFKLLHYKPELWNTLKSALVIENMAETLCAGEDDLESTNALQLLGRETFDYLFPEWNPKQQAIIPDTGQWKNIRPMLRAANPTPAQGAATSALPFAPNSGDLAQIRELEGVMDGSNNWAISGKLSKSGKAILANDPHLTLTLPAIWYQVQLHTPEINAHGVSLPGIPGIALGFNENVAWGFTNVGHDVSDWYQIKWADDKRMQYIVDGASKDVRLRIETIGIKGKPALIDTVRYTEWGPVVYDHESDNELRDCALRWISHEEPDPRSMEIFLGLNKANDYAGYRDALAGYDCPAQNIVFATRSGDIALQVQGRYPVRAPQQGRLVQDGSTADNAWHGFIPQDQIPSMKNPARGFVFSANQHSTLPSYPYYYIGGFEDYRSRRIYNRLAALRDADATADTLKAMQLDNFSQRAADALPLMLKMLDRTQLDAEGQQIVRELEGWNFQYEAAMTAPPFYEVWFDSLYLYTWDEMETVRKQKRPILFPEAWRTIDLMERDSANVFFDRADTPAKETARDLVNESFRGMQRYFRQNPQKRTNWAAFRGFALKHLAQIDAFSRLDLAVDGHRTAPNAVSRTHGPSWRMVVELGDPVRAWGVFPGGQSGNPGSRFYDNMVATWAEGQYFELMLLNSPSEGGSRIIGKQTFE